MSDDPTYASVRNTRHPGGRVIVSAPTYDDLVQLRFVNDGLEAHTFITPTDAQVLVYALTRVLAAQQAAKDAINQLTLPEAA